MQSVNTLFHQKATGAVRGITTRCLISWLKVFNENITFFTIGTSTIGGTDVIRGDNSVIQEWDKYRYEDFANRIISVEYDRQSELPQSPVTLAMADVTLDNHDDLFTPENTSSPYYGYLKAARPIKLYVGFNHAYDMPVFVGLTEGRPVVDEKSKTVKLHCIDFLRSIMNIKLEEEIIYEDMRIDQIISALLQSVGGLLTSQYQLDYATTTIPFAYFKKESTLGDALRELVEAELGSLYMDEVGVIRFENRTNWNSKTRVWGFDKSQVLDISTPADDKIINVCIVKARPRSVQANQLLWETANSIELAPSADTEVFANFKDDYGDLPVTTVDDPLYLTGASTSLYATNTDRDSNGDANSTAVSLISTDQFSTGFKMVFRNTSTSTMYLTQLELWARPAKVTNDIFLRLEDTSSIGTNREGFDERIFEIDNDYIQDSGAANTIAQMVLTDNSLPNAKRTMLVKGLPQLQVGDVVGYKDLKVNEAYFVTRINGIINKGSGFQQTIEVSKRTLRSYFRIGISTIGGTDVIGP